LVQEGFSWYTEDLRAVPEQDASRVAILHGKVAAGFTVKINESVGEIFWSKSITIKII